MRFLISFTLAISLSACSSLLPLHKAVPEAQVSQAQVVGFPDSIRNWADEAPASFEDSVARRMSAFREANAGYYQKHKRYPELHYLALSGGAYDGAFGAGFLTGWSDAGTRPDFAIVSGVSTGALIAPLVFIGPKYDDDIEQMFTTLDSQQVFLSSFWGAVSGLVRGASLTDNTPLKKRIEEKMTEQVMEEIAVEHRKGKRLYIGTTNIEAQRGVIWDIGEIANSGNPGSLELIRKILLASAAIPGFFEPVFIDVETQSGKYSEIHVDGGTTSQVFIYPLKLRRSIIDSFRQAGLKRHMYIIRNGKITPEYEALEPGVLALSKRSLETLTKTQGIGDLYRLYIGAQRDGIDYNLVHIPESFHQEADEVFDPEYMGALFTVGYEMGKQPGVWKKKPPGVEYQSR